MFEVNEGEIVSVRVIQSANNGTIKWANTHEYRALARNNFFDAQTLALELAEVHKAFLLPAYKVERVVVSTWVPDGVPYNPDTFASFSFGMQGSRTRAGSEPTDLTVCLLLDRRVQGGRNGRILLRGCLTEEMLTAVGGRYNFQQPSSLDGVDFNAAMGRLLSAIYVPTNNAVWGMVMHSELGTRPIDAFVNPRITFKKLRNKYFDRS